MPRRAAGGASTDAAAAGRSAPEAASCAASVACSTVLQATGDAGALAVQDCCSCSRLPCLKHGRRQHGTILLRKVPSTDVSAAGSNAFKIHCWCSSAACSAGKPRHWRRQGLLLCIMMGMRQDQPGRETSEGSPVCQSLLASQPLIWRSLKDHVGYDKDDDGAAKRDNLQMLLSACRGSCSRSLQITIEPASGSLQCPFTGARTDPCSAPVLCCMKALDCTPS